MENSEQRLFYTFKMGILILPQNELPCRKQRRLKKKHSEKMANLEGLQVNPQNRSFYRETINYDNSYRKLRDDHCISTLPKTSIPGCRNHIFAVRFCYFKKCSDFVFDCPSINISSQ